VQKYCRGRKATGDSRCMHVACWTPKGIDTDSECVRLTAFPLQQWLHKHISLLHYMYVACLVLPICLMQGEKYAILHAVCDVAE
jgi:hypothetical protein